MDLLSGAIAAESLRTSSKLIFSQVYLDLSPEYCTLVFHPIEFQKPKIGIQLDWKKRVICWWIAADARKDKEGDVFSPFSENNIHLRVLIALIL